MSGGFFRGTSSDQDTRFSNKNAKLLKTHKFPPELNEHVDISKVAMDVMKPWIAKRVTEILGGVEDDVLINFIYGLLEQSKIDGKDIQIQLTGFLEKNTSKFMKELWSLLLSAQKNVSGIPQQFIDEKAEETRRKKEIADRMSLELMRHQAESAEQNRKMTADVDAARKAAAEAAARLNKKLLEQQQAKLVQPTVLEVPAVSTVSLPLPPPPPPPPLALPLPPHSTHLASPMVPVFSPEASNALTAPDPSAASPVKDERPPSAMLENGVSSDVKTSEQDIPAVTLELQKSSAKRKEASRSLSRSRSRSLSPRGQDGRSLSPGRAPSRSPVIRKRSPPGPSGSRRYNRSRSYSRSPPRRSPPRRRGRSPTPPLYRERRDVRGNSSYGRGDRGSGGGYDSWRDADRDRRGRGGDRLHDSRSSRPMREEYIDRDDRLDRLYERRLDRRGEPYPDSNRGSRRDGGYGDSVSDRRDAGERFAHDDKKGAGDRDRAYSDRPQRSAVAKQPYRELEARDDSPSPPLPPPPPRRTPPPRAIDGSGARRGSRPVAAPTAREDASDASEEYEGDKGRVPPGVQQQKAELRRDEKREQPRREPRRQETQMVEDEDEEYEEEERLEEERRGESARRLASRNISVKNGVTGNGGGSRRQAYSKDEESEDEEMVAPSLERDRTGRLSGPSGLPASEAEESVKRGREILRMEPHRSAKPENGTEYDNRGASREHARRQPKQEPEMEESENDTETERDSGRHARKLADDRTREGDKRRTLPDEYEMGYEDRVTDVGLPSEGEGREAKRMKLEATASGAGGEGLLSVPPHSGHIGHALVMETEQLSEKQVKQKRKEEKRLRKEERRKKREEKRKRKEGKKAAKDAKRLRKSSGEDNQQGFLVQAVAQKQAEGPQRAKQDVRMDDVEDEEGRSEEDESADEDEELGEEEQRRVEEALRKRAMESLRAKKLADRDV